MLAYDITYDGTVHASIASSSKCLSFYIIVSPHDCLTNVLGTSVATLKYFFIVSIAVTVLTSPFPHPLLPEMRALVSYQTDCIIIIIMKNTALKLC